MTDKWAPTVTAQREIAIQHSDGPLEIVFLPGLLCTERLWAAQIDGLADIAHSTVARLDTADNMAGLAASVLEQAPAGAFMLVGLSMGGYVAFEMMRQQPERVLGLALLSTSARPDTPEATATRRAQMALADQDLGAVVEQLLPKLLQTPVREESASGLLHSVAKELGAESPGESGGSNSRGSNASPAAIVRSMAAELGADVFKRQQQAIIGRPDSRLSLHEITCPTLVLCGEEDEITPPEIHTEIAQAITGAHLAVIRNCGHLAPLEQPDAVTRELRSWLRETHSTYALR